MVCDQPERILLGELIREQVLLHTREEVPRSVAVTIDRIEEMPAKEGPSRTAVLATVRGTKEPERHSDQEGAPCLKRSAKGWLQMRR